MSRRLIEPQCRHGVVPVIRTPSAKLAGRAVDWLNEAGFRTFELAMPTKGVTGLVAEISSDVELDVGVGAVMDAEQAGACIEAGAGYVVTPGIAAGVVTPCRDAGIACLLGASTPSEVMQAVGLGADAVAVFPAGSLGGVPYFKALKAVFPDVPLVPTGGIEIGHVARYLRAGAAFVGVGSGLVDTKALCLGDKDAIIDAAANALDQVEKVKAPPKRKR